MSDYGRHFNKQKRPKAPVRQVRKAIATKFSECSQCIFYCARRVNVACNTCDIGENFEERIRGLNPNRDNDFDGTDGRGDED